MGQQQRMPGSLMEEVVRVGLLKRAVAERSGMESRLIHLGVRQT